MTCFRIIPNVFAIAALLLAGCATAADKREAFCIAQAKQQSEPSGICRTEVEPPPPPWYEGAGNAALWLLGPWTKP